VFVQVIQGRVSDAAAAHGQLEKWVKVLAPGAEGRLGGTAGVTQAGELVVLARFESEDAAQHNSDRPEQGTWREETSELFSGEPEFRDNTQVMQGRTSDPERSRELMAAGPTDWSSFRPELLGTLVTAHEDGSGRWRSTSPPSAYDRHIANTTSEFGPGAVDVGSHPDQQPPDSAGGLVQPPGSRASTAHPPIPVAPALN